MNVSHFQQTPTPDRLDQLANLHAPFSIIRFMNWQQTNLTHWGNQTTFHNWEDLPSDEDDWMYKGGAWDSFKGVPISFCINYANKINCRPWINIPHTATDTLIQEISDLAITQSKRKPIIEFSNEVWNAQFGQHEHAVKMGREAGLGAHRLESAWHWHAHQTRFIKEFVTTNADVVIGAQFFRPEVAQSQLRACGDIVDALAVAPYLGRKQRHEGRTNEAIGLELHTEIDTEIVPLFDQYTSMCDQYGIELYAYEGGLHHMGQSAEERPLWAEFNRSSDAADVTARLWMEWQISGGSIACPYSIATVYKNYWNDQYQNTFFGHCEITQDSIEILPKYAAALDVLELD